MAETTAIALVDVTILPYELEAEGWPSNVNKL
jgi:hypothetical protein